jgi:hypothetical protein
MDEHYNEQVPEGYEPGSDKDIHVTSIVFVGIIGAVLIVVIVMLLKALYYQTLNEERAHKLGSGVDVALSDLRSKQLEQIGSYRWVDAHAGKVGIPIEEAMTLVWQEQAAHANNGIEITDWDHMPSDLHAVPGNQLALNPFWGASVASFGAREAHVVEDTANDQENMSGTDHTPPDAAVETEAEQISPEAEHDGDEAAGGHN